VPITPAQTLRFPLLSSSLDPLESTVTEDIDPLPTACEVTEEPLQWPFKHTGWRQLRERIYSALIATGQPTHRVHAFATCSTSAWLLQSKTDPRRLKIVSATCHDRFCVPCAAARACVIRRNLATQMADEPYRLITLTLRARQTHLSAQIDRLYACFKRLRSTALWTENVRGGFAILEVTWNVEDHHWHPHLHIIATGNYIPHKRLSDEWLRITGDSFIVHLALIRSAGHAARYVTKYVTKPLSDSVSKLPSRLEEAVSAFKGRKLIICFGDWKNWRLLSDPDEESWRLLGRIDDFLHHHHGDHDLCDYIQSIWYDWRNGNHPSEFVYASERSPPPLPPYIVITVDLRPLSSTAS
jgi:hypothetical protein